MLVLYNVTQCYMCHTMFHVLHNVTCVTQCCMCYTTSLNKITTYLRTDVISSRTFMSTRTQAKLSECEMRSRSATNSMICSVSNKPYLTQTTISRGHMTSRPHNLLLEAGSCLTTRATTRRQPSTLTIFSIYQQFFSFSSKQQIKTCFFQLRQDVPQTVAVHTHTHTHIHI